MVRRVHVPGKYDTVVVGGSRTKQSFAKECDINNIMARYQKDGIIAHVARVEGRYGDFTGPVDYQTACNQVIAAQDMFLTLPASIRSRFDNDPGDFLKFALDEANRDELQKMGLLKAAVPEPSPAKVFVVNPGKDVVDKIE